MKLADVKDWVGGDCEFYRDKKPDPNPPAESDTYVVKCPPGCQRAAMLEFAMAGCPDDVSIEMAGENGAVWLKFSKP